MIISMHQPNFCPYLGYFYKIYKSDVFVFLDDTNYAERNFQNYNYIKTPNGRLRISIPVSSYNMVQLKDLKIKNDRNWKEKLLNTLYYNYKKTPFFEEIFDDLKQIIDYPWERLIDLNIAFIKHVSLKFGFSTEFCISSSLKTEGKKERKVIETCLKLEATEYLSGNGAKTYQCEQHFLENGIYLSYSDFHEEVRKQQWGAFESNLSILDYLFNYGYINPFVYHPKFVAFVPIKMNSERLKNKNLLDFNGKPLCSYIFRTLSQVPYLDNIFVFCSDIKIRDYIQRNIVFLKRDSSLDSNQTLGIEIYKSFVKSIDSDYYVLAHATSPLLKPQTIINAIRQIVNNGFDSALSVKKEQTFCWFKGVPLNYHLQNVPRTQDINPVFFETSGFYIFDRQTLIQYGQRVGKKPYFAVVDNVESLDIDTADDFNFGLKILKGSGL